MRIEPLPALADNYIWLIVSGRRAVCVDPGESAPVLAYLQRHGLELVQIWITHLHADHTGGIEGLRRAYPSCQVFGYRDIAERSDTVDEGSVLDFVGCPVRVWAVPGHTPGHVAYLLHDRDRRWHVFCGDTLFSAGCGRILGGSMTDLYRSLQRFNRLPADTLFYPAHEYTAANLAFAAHIEPQNADIRAAQTASWNTPTLPVSLAHERRVNPFLRVGQAVVRDAAVRYCSQVADDEEAVFTVLREWKNRF